jgi:hypothetical protein
MRYSCPLCGHPVSLSLYRKITGVWQERQRVLEKIRQQRAALLKSIREDKKRLRKAKAQFRDQKARLVRQEVDRRTRRIELKIGVLRRREKENEKRARDQIRRAAALAHRQAERLAATRLSSFKKDLRATVRDQLRKERERGAREAQTRYERLNIAFRSTLKQMRSQSGKIREQERQIRELESQLESQTTPQIEGLLYEDKLIKELKRRFREDKFQHTGKGGDVIQTVVWKHEQAGIIMYECKRVKHYSARHVKQASEAKQKRKADFAILVTNAMKKGTQGFYVERGVMVVHAAGVLSFANLIRNQIIRITEMKLGRLQRNMAMRLTLEYLEGPEFSNSMDAIIQESIALYEGLKDEARKHLASWKKRYSSYKKVYEEAFTVKNKSRALLSGRRESKELAQRETLPALPDLSELEKTVPSRESTENRTGEAG